MLIFFGSNLFGSFFFAIGFISFIPFVVPAIGFVIGFILFVSAITFGFFLSNGGVRPSFGN